MFFGGLSGAIKRQSSRHAMEVSRRDGQSKSLYAEHLLRKHKAMGLDVVCVQKTSEGEWRVVIRANPAKRLDGDA